MTINFTFVVDAGVDAGRIEEKQQRQRLRESAARQQATRGFELLSGIWNMQDDSQVLLSSLESLGWRDYRPQTRFPF